MIRRGTRAAVTAAVAGVAAAGVAVAGGLALGWYVATRATVPVRPRRFAMRLFGLRQVGDRTAVGIEASPGHAAPGVYSVFFPGGHAVVGAVLEQDRRVVWRALDRVDSGNLAAAQWGAWSGYVYTAPHQLALPWHDVAIPAPNGPAPAWCFPATGTQRPAATWAIHIHGLGSTRAGMLRGIPAFTRAGVTSLLVSYRNDGTGPHVGTGRNTLGATEAEDIDAAIAYALNQGAEQVVLVGWSMGAQIALRAAIDGPHADRVAGMIGVSPVLDWEAVLQQNCAQANLPAVVGSLATWLLANEVGARTVGLRRPIPMRSMNWLTRANEVRIPLLLLHGAQDRSVPTRTTREFAVRRPEAGVEIFDAGHTTEWNSDPQRWERAVSNWLRTLQ